MRTAARRQGVIPTRMVNRFHDRKRDDLSRWKYISNKELDRREAMLPVACPIWTPLKKHQRVCTVLGARMKKLLILNDTGTGKTYLAIALMAYHKKAGNARRNLILVPNKINKGEWAREGFDKHAPWLKYVVLQGSSEDKWQQMRDNPKADAFIDTYSGFSWVCSDLKVNKRKKKKKPELVLNPTKMKKVVAFFDGVYADESTFLASIDTLAFRIVRAITAGDKICVPMTATPFGRDLAMLWPQAYLVDEGYTLGETMGLFRAAFFDAKDKFFGGVEWKPKKGAKELISKYLDDISICYPADAADLPHVNRIPVHVPMPEAAWGYIEKARAEIIAAHGNQREMNNAFLKMRQISSGFIGYKDDESGERASYVFPNNPKLDMLEAKLLEIPQHEKIIIFHEFNHSAHVLEKMIKRIGLGYVMINGMIRDTNPAKIAFKEDPKAQVLILSNAAGGYGLNLQNARWGIYYESPVPVILRKQTEKRFDRQYSLHQTVFLLDFIVEGTADQSILDFHREGRNLWAKVLNTGTTKH